MALAKKGTATTMGAFKLDSPVPSDDEDTISSLSWSPVADRLAAASWDGQVRIYDVASSGSAKGVAKLSAGGPVFDCDWAKTNITQDGSMILAGGADKKNHLLHVATGQQISIGRHDAPVRGVRFVSVQGTEGPCFASGSWDQTVKLFDIRTGDTPGISLSCHDRVYSMDTRASLLVVATAELKIHLVDLRNPREFLNTVTSQLGHQTTVVKALTDGWITGSIGGRCAVNNVVDGNKKSPHDYTFRCHRHPNTKKDIDDVFTLNDIALHPVLQKNCCVTAGSDGSLHFWDLTKRLKHRGYPRGTASDGKHPDAITAVSFSRDGSFLAYATGYDWSRGCAGNTPMIKTKVMLHTVTKEDKGKVI